MGILGIIFGLTVSAINGNKRYKEQKRVMEIKNNGLKEHGFNYYYDIDGNKLDSKYHCRFVDKAPGQWAIDPKTGTMQKYRARVYRYDIKGNVIRDLTNELKGKISDDCQFRRRETHERFVLIKPSYASALRNQTDDLDSEFLPKGKYCDYFDCNTFCYCFLQNTSKFGRVYRDGYRGTILGIYHGDEKEYHYYRYNPDAEDGCEDLGYLPITKERDEELVKLLNIKWGYAK